MNEKGAILPTVIALLLLTTSVLIYVNDLTISHMKKLLLLEEHYINQATLLYAEQVIEAEYVDTRPENLVFSFNTGDVTATKTDENTYNLTFNGGQYVPSTRQVNLPEIEVEEESEGTLDTEEAD